MQEIEKLEVDRHSKDERIKEVTETLAREEKARSSIQESVAKSAEIVANLQGELTAMKDRLLSEVERGNRLEKELLEIARSRGK